MSALFTALVEGETKESLAKMVCELREELVTVTGLAAGYAAVADDPLTAELYEGLKDLQVALLADRMSHDGGGLTEASRKNAFAIARALLAKVKT